MSTLPVTDPSSVRPFIAQAGLRIRFLLLGALLLGVTLGSDRADAAVVNAVNCSLVAVQSACAVAQPGDTVQVPAGVATWSLPLTITKDIQVIGAGIGQTIITNNVYGTLINWTTFAGGTCRLSGFDFEPGPPDQQSSAGTTRLISVGGNCHAFRLDNCLFNKINEYNLWFSGWVYGVVDHCNFNAVYSLMEVQMQTYGGQQYGDGSWADPDYWGTTNALYIESCNFLGPVGAHIGMLDGVDGQRVVVRYCNSTNCPIGTHGTDSTGRDRSVRSYEIYNNNFIYQTNGWPAWNQVIYLRGGTALIYNNTIWGGYQSVVGLADYRYIPVTWAPFGQVTGVNPWDSNNPALFDSGTATATGGPTVLVDTTKHWTPNQWANPAAPYVLYDLTQGFAVIIAGNTANSLSCYGSFEGYPGNNGSGSMIIQNGDAYQIRQVYATLDQCGVGQGDLLTGLLPINTTTGTAAWPHQAYDPVYIWGNNFTFALPPGSYPSSLIGSSAGYYVTGVPKPGYAPLPFPHPLVGPAAGGTPSLYTLTVNGGTGSGNYAAGSTVAIAAATVTGQVFTNWSGDTSCLPNNQAAAATFAMPASQVTLTANYCIPGVGDITNGLVAQWLLAGNAKDQLGNNNGAAFGGPAYVFGPKGAASSAVGLNGLSQYVATTTLGNFGANCAAGFTLTAWVKSGYTGNYEAVFGSQGPSGMTISLYLNYSGGVSPGLIQAIVRDQANTIHSCDVQNNTGITDGNWHFIAWVDNPGANTGNIYVDGVRMNTALSGAPIRAPGALPNPMGLGYRAGLNDGLFNGALADCRIYNRTLSPAEVSTLYVNGAAGGITAHLTPPGDLQAHAPTIH